MGWRSSIARRWRGTVSPTRARAADGRHTACSGGFVSRDQLGGLACSARQAGREGSAGKLEAASTRRRHGVRALVAHFEGIICSLIQRQQRQQGF